MFRPSGLLASQIVPTAATYRRRAAEAFTSEQNMRRCLRMHRICLPPAQAIGGVGTYTRTYTPLDSQPCRLLQRYRDVSPIKARKFCSVEAERNQERQNPNKGQERIDSLAPVIVVAMALTSGQWATQIVQSVKFRRQGQDCSSITSGKRVVGHGDDLGRRQRIVDGRRVQQG
jgi:hypothetical protein